MSHHESFGLFMPFAGKLSHSRSVSVMFHHFPFFFSYWCNFCFQIPVKCHNIHWFFFMISSVTRLDYSFLGVFCCCIRWGIRFHIFFGHFWRVVFHSRHSTGSFCRTLSFQYVPVKIILECVYYNTGWHIQSRLFTLNNLSEYSQNPW